MNNKELLRIHSDEVYRNLSENEIHLELQKMHEDIDGGAEQIRDRLKKFQRKRHWLVWHDHSTLSNYGHMLFCLRELYDPAIHLTNNEAKAKLGKDVDVQATVEKPHLYILGQSGSSIEEQMKFVKTRQDDLKLIRQTITTDERIEVVDEMRFMNGDNPSVQFESGNQHGGHKGCSGCDGDLNLSYDLEYMSRRKYLTLEERKKLVVAGREGKKGKLHPFKELNVHTLRAELTARGIADVNNLTKPDLTQTLNKVLGGTTRIPALLFGDNITAENLNLEHYEVLYFEALHCSMNHIKNVMQELHHHISDIDTLIKLKEILAVQLSKEKMRGVDYRKTLIYLTIALYQTATRDVRALLVTLCEMVEIFYSQDQKRSPKLILRLHNICWRHAIQCRKVLTPARALTYRKLFGLYFHACVSHSAFLLRLVSHRSTNAEMFERLFEELTDITRKTWNKKIEDLASNAVLHLQAKTARGFNAVVKQEQEISNISKSLPKLGNTILPREIIHTYAVHWEAHLKAIADFLLPGEGVWWQVIEGECVEFFDGPEEPNFREQGPPLHHFRSSSIKSEHQYLMTCWGQCNEKEVPIPATMERDTNGRWIASERCLLRASEDNPGLEIVHTDMESCDPTEDSQSTEEPEMLEEEEDLHEECQSDETESTLEGYQPYKPAATAELQEHTDEPENNRIEVKQHQQEMTCETEDDQPPSKEETHESLLSKTAKALALILGRSKDVVTYDKLRNNAAKNPNSRYHKERYLNHLAHIQVQVLKTYREVNKASKEWSASFQRSHQKTPTEKDLNTDPSISAIQKKIKVALELLKVWKMTVHTV